MRFLYVSLTFLAVAAAAWLAPVIRNPTPGGEAAAIDPSLVRRQSIAFYERRLTEDAHSALDMAQLGALMMEEGRLTGDERAFVRAESLARRSLGERTKKNGRSAALLTHTLLAQHRFDDAREVARGLAEAEPDESAYRALHAETLLEVGDYENAVTELGATRAHRQDLGIAPRFARWAELTGRVGEARRILQAARDEARGRVDLTGEQRAWFSLRLADVELRHGNLRRAARAIDEGLRESPGDGRLILARSRLEATRGSWRAAVRYAEEVIATAPNPEAFAIMATAKRSLGLVDEAEALDAVLENMLSQPGAIHRNWAFTLVDRGKGVDAVVAAVSADTLVRQDIHTLDLLAWTLHAAGRSGEALPIARRAMRTGSVEPSLRYHAGVIEASAGDPAAARRHFEIALGRGTGLSRHQVSAIHRLMSARATAARN